MINAGARSKKVDDGAPKVRTAGPAWHLRLMGDPALVALGGQVHPLERRAAALFALVAIEPGVSRQRLATLLWPDSKAAQARQALRQQLRRIKRFAGEVLTGDGALSLAANVRSDLDSGEGPGGALLGDFDYSDSEELAHWVARQRQTRHGHARASLVDAIAAAEAAGDLEAAITSAESLIEVDDGEERDQRTLMRLLYLHGDAARALAVYERLHQSLQREHGARPSTETEALAQTIRAAVEAPLPVPRRRHAPASLLRPPRLVGRDAELADIERAWEEQRIFVLVGEAGLGKSRLLEELAARRGRCVIAQARPGDSSTPYASLARWLRAVLAQMARNDVVVPALPRQALAPLLPELGLDLQAQPAGGQLWLRSAVESLLTAASDDVHAVLVDDLHFADAASLETLQALLVGDALAPMCWGLAHRPVAEDSAVNTLWTALQDTNRGEAIALGPLDRNALAELIESLAVPELDASRLVPSLVRHTGGNPMFALETLKGLWLQGGRAGLLPRPGSVATLIDRRLRQLSPAALNLARVAAIATVDFSIELAEEVLDLKALALADAWRELETAQVLRGGGFAHDLVFEAALASVPLPIARHTHAAVARVLERANGDAARIAGHWLDAGQSAQALGALHRAAESARVAMRPREQAQFLEQAAAIERDAGRADAAFGSLRDAVAARFLADRSGLDDAALDRLAAAALTPVQQADAMRLRCEVLTARGDYEQVVDVAEQALALAGDDQALRCELLQAQGGALSLSGQFRRAIDVMRQAEPWLEREGSADQRVALHGDLAVALDNADRYGEAQTEHRRALDLALANGEHANAVTVLANLAVSFSHTGQLEQATEALLRGERLAAAHDDARGSAATIPSLLSRCLRDQSRFGEALRWAEVGLHELQTQAPAWVGAMRVHLANLYLLMGQTARAWRELDQVGAEDKMPAWQRSALWLAQSRLKAMLGQPHGELLDKALAAAPAQGRRPLRAALTLAHAAGLAPATALCVASEVASDAALLGMQGVRLSAMIRATQFATAAGDHAVALAHADAALALSETTHPDEMYRGELWLHVARAHAGACHDEAAAVWQARGAQWVRDTAENHVPESFRDSFLQRQPVNVALLGHGTRSLFIR